MASTLSASYTTPDQTIEMHAADRPPQGPALHRDLDRHDSAAERASPLLMIAAAVLFIAITAFFVLVR